MKVVGFVPVKLNNERLPGKNTKAFSDGKPLISCILETLSTVNELDEIYVYCSDPEIQNYFPNKKIRYLSRSEYLDQSTTKINEVLSSFAKDVKADIYLLAHATAPFIKSERFSEGIKAVLSDKYDSAFSVTKLQEFLWKNGKPFNYDPALIPRTQDLPVMYSETSGLYIYKKDLILSQNRRIGQHPYIIEVSDIEAIDIDEPIDFEIANAVYTNILKYRCENAQMSFLTTGGVIFNRYLVNVHKLSYSRKGGMAA